LSYIQKLALSQRFGQFAHMSMVHASSVESLQVHGGCEFLTRSSRGERCRELAERGYIVARVAPVATDDCEPESRPGVAGPLRRGSLRQAIEGAVEISLALRGSLPPGVDIAAHPEEAANDQLLRMRKLGATGLCVVLPALQRLASDHGVLHSDDSAALQVWRTLCEQAEVTLLFDANDRELSVLAPRALTDVFGDLVRDVETPRSWAEDVRALGEAVDEAIDEEPDAPFEDEDDDLADVDPQLPLDALSQWTAEPAAVESHQRWYREPAEEPAEKPAEKREAAAPAARHEARAKAQPERDAGRVMQRDPLEGIETIGADGERQGSLFDEVRREPLSAPPPPLKPPMPGERVRAFAADLREAAGPKPVRTIEKLFRERYAPLLEAIGQGQRDRDAHEAVAAWRESFEHSYTEAFTAMRVTGKRPSMVLDTPEIATRIARLNGARSVQLLLVDSMRFDLGERVQLELRERIGEVAVCVEQTQLWSALPTLTPTQLRLLSRGALGLRDPEPQSERNSMVHRGKSVTTLRRVRIGQRDLVKLDVVEARLREAGPGFDERMDGIATEVSQVIARFCESLPPRTLLYVFGDHGFQLPTESPFATGPATQGGASPEEVLVSGYAWLLGDVH
jgi:hypothetical protein